MNCPRLHLTLLLIAAMFAAQPAFAQTDTRTLGSFTYDGSGNVTSMGPDSDGLMNEYEYDSAGRLIHFVRRDASTGTTVLTESYEYDAYGNQTRQTTNSVVTSLSADAGTNRLTGATYDQAGNMTQYGGESYTFDPVGTMTTKSGSWGTATYIYTADDERIAIAGPDGTWRYTARDLDGKVLREWSAGTWDGSWSWVEDYVYRDGRLAAAVRPASQGGTRHFHLDHLGSPRLISGDSKSLYAQHAYYPFGREISSPTQELSLGYDTPEPMKYTGHERDFAGSYSGPVLDYMHARYYNPWTARFLSVDPVLGDPAVPQSWNRYTYAGNNPLLFTDPTGEFVDLTSLTEEQRRALVDGLNQFTGNTYGVDSNSRLTLVSVGSDSSATATAYVNGLIESADAYNVSATTRAGESWYNAGANRIEIDFSAFDRADYNGIDPRTFNLGSTAIHEWTHQTTGLFDTPDGQFGTPQPQQIGWTGPVVDAVNVMRFERGLPTRESYVSTRVPAAGWRGLLGIGASRSAMRFFDPQRGRVVQVIRNVR